jgi:hypothetical protein
MDYHVFSITIEEVNRVCLSVLPKKMVEDKGLHNKAIAGFLKTGQVDPEGFIENQAFKEFLHQVMAAYLPKQEAFLEQGKTTGTGYVYLVDKRTKNTKGDVPMQDIIGALNFENGDLVPDSYLPNRNYKLLTGKGFFQLPYSLEQNLLEAINQS